MQWYLALAIIIMVILCLRVLWTYLKLRSRGPDENKKFQQEAWNKAMDVMYGGKKE